MVKTADPLIQYASAASSKPVPEINAMDARLTPPTIDNITYATSGE